MGAFYAVPPACSQLTRPAGAHIVMEDIFHSDWQLTMHDDDTPIAARPPQEDDPVLLLVRKIQEGKDVEKSSEELHRIFYRPVVAFFQRRGFPLEEARDLTQDVFLRIFRGISTFQGTLRFERWLFGIAATIWKNELRWRDANRRGDYEKPLDATVDKDHPADWKVVEPMDPKPGTLDLVQARERQELLRAALQELPPQMRHVCELRYIQGRKYQEIVDLLEVSIETVKAHLHQARKRLTSKLSLQHPGLEDLESYRSGRLPRLREHVKTCQFCSGLLLELDRVHSPLGADSMASDSEIDANWKELIDRELPLLVWRDFPAKDKARFQSLIVKREDGTLSPEEQQELIRLSDQAERWQAEKLRVLADLAASRGTSIVELLQELEAETSSR